MNRYLKALLILVLLLLVSMVIFYGSFIFALIYADQANYYSESIELGSPEYYERATSNAKEAGYKTELYYVNAKENEISGLRPGAVEGLDPILGSDYLVTEIKFYYSNSSFLKVSFSENKEAIISFENEKIYEGSPEESNVKGLPNKEWLINKFKIIFGMEEKEIEADLPKEILGANNEILVAPLTVPKPLDFAATRRHLIKEATNSIFDTKNARGEGGCSETFYNNGNKTGNIDYIVPNIEISHREGWHTYIIKIDRTGGMYLKINLGPNSAGETIPEEEYRNVFKKMFEDLGLPQEKLSGLAFNYNGYVW